MRATLVWRATLALSCACTHNIRGRHGFDVVDSLAELQAEVSGDSSPKTSRRRTTLALAQSGALVRAFMRGRRHADIAAGSGPSAGNESVIVVTRSPR